MASGIPGNLLLCFMPGIPEAVFGDFVLMFTGSGFQNSFLTVKHGLCICISITEDLLGCQFYNRAYFLQGFHVELPLVAEYAIVVGASFYPLLLEVDDILHGSVLQEVVERNAVVGG